MVFIWTILFALNGFGSAAGMFEYLLGGASSASHLVKRLTFPGGAYITNTYDNVARLSATILRNSGHATISSHGYLVNQGNQRYRQTFTAGNLIDYTYDDIGQLKTAHGNESGEETPYEHYTFGYGYDAAGNLQKRTNNLLVQTFTANPLNQLSNVTRSGTLTVGGVTTIPATVTVNGQTATTYSDNSFSRAGFTLTNGNNTFTAVAADANGRGDTNSVMVNLPATVAFTYDANGNLTSDGRRGFDYDDENQLVCVTVTNDWKSEFVYDGLLRRRITRDYAWRNSTWVQTSETRYIYDGLLPIQERDRFNVPRVTYTRGLDLSGTLAGAGGIGGLLARTDHSPLTPYHSFYHADGSGNVTTLINPAQQVVAKYHYDPFGNTLAKTGPLADANTYRFSSKEIHSASGLLYYGYRFYEPNVQRWLNEDPLGEDGGINLYGFIENDPVSAVDTEGLSRFPNPRGPRQFSPPGGRGQVMRFPKGPGPRPPRPPVHEYPPGLSPNELRAICEPSTFNPYRTGRRPSLTQPVGELRAQGKKDAHHVVQDAAVRDIPGYNTQRAAGVPLAGPSNKRGTPHYNATQAQRRGEGGTLGAELRNAYNALRAAGYSDAQARQAVAEAEAYFRSIGATRSTPTCIPGDRY